MFGTVVMECKACKKNVDADLVAHGNDACIIEFSCGHTMSCTPTRTTWRRNGVLDRIENRGEEKNA